ncbi:MAG: SWIM zinc finger family protein [Ichthyobacteriaceae bacterium]|nr:SWIM zinc finger family protein [Ichthyobacteriaceae bacterium]
MNSKFMISHVDALSSPSIRGLGKRSFLDKKVYSASIINAETFSFRVKDDFAPEKGFGVMVLNPESVNITTSCTCEYAQENLICKHQVAVIYYLIDDENIFDDSEDEALANSRISKTVKEEVKVIKTRKATKPLIIKDYKDFSYDQLMKLGLGTSGREDLNAYFNSYTHAELKYEVRSYYRIYENNINVVKIIANINDTVGVVCSCNEEPKMGELCSHAKIVFSNLLKVENRKLLSFLGSSGKEVVFKYAESYLGIKKEIFKNHYDYSLTEKGVTAFKKQKSKDLMLNHDWESKGIQGILVGINSTSNFKSLIPDIKDHEHLGFSIVFNLSNTADINVDPLTAKTNKQGTALASNFVIHSPKYNINSFPYEFESEFPKLLNLLGRFRDLRKDISSLVDLDVNKMYLLLSQIFDETVDLNHSVYYLQSNSNYKFQRRDLHQVEISLLRVGIKFKVTADKDTYKLNVVLVLDNEEFYVSQNNVDDLLVNDFVFLHKNTLHLFKNIKHQRTLASFKEIPDVMVLKSDYFTLYQNLILPLSKQFEVDLSEVKGLKVSEEKIKPLYNCLYLKEQESSIVFIPKIVFEGDVEIDLLSDSSFYTEEKKVITYDRNFNDEQIFLNQIEDLHPDFNSQRDLGVYYLEFDKVTKSDWFLNAFEELRKNNIKVFGLNELKRFKYSTHRANISTGVKSGQDWFDVELTVSFGDYTLTIGQLKKIVKKNDRYVELGNGEIGILPKEWFDKIKQIFRYSDSATKDGVKISKMKFSMVDELFESIDEAEILEEIMLKKERLLSFKEISNVDVPKEINAELRGYQKEGFNWLNFLDENKWGGILADDMGLGKTLQILTFIQQQKNINPKATSIIVLPTTLVFNWKKEIDKFANNITALYHVGAGRQKNIDGFEDYDLVITTYGALLNDIVFLKDFKFKYAVLDESQAIKNPNSKRYKSALLLRAENKIAMTGTPIENNTFDLYAQMNFVNPGFLGSQTSFKTEYSLPIDKDRNDDVAKDLHKLIRPFIMRRTKEQVATELPEKIEDVLYCEMEPEQTKVYEAYRNKYREYLMNKFDENGLKKSKMYVLEGLTRLRQICDSPSLISEEEIYTSESAKIKVLLTHIEEKTNNHKILVFSQFVKMLHLVEKELERRNISYEYLDGKKSGKQRSESVDNFQNNSDVRVFLISLKAGGTGLNLTAADYVYLLDPWWNPAVENQAIDRAYRIGQDKKVIAYRMIAKGTIEEKIMNIQSKKRKVASDIIQTDESVFKELSQDDIMDLFK